MNAPHDTSDDLEKTLRQDYEQLMRKTTSFNLRINSEAGEMDQESACENGVCKVVWKPQRPAA